METIMIFHYEERKRERGRERERERERWASRTLNEANVFHHSVKPQNSDFNSYIYILI